MVSIIYLIIYITVTSNIYYYILLSLLYILLYITVTIIYLIIYITVTIIYLIIYYCHYYISYYI